MNKGYTLIEILMMSAVLLMLVGQAIRLGMEGTAIVDETSKEISLQTGVRNLIENMVQDINSSVVFLNTSNKKMILARYEKTVDNDLFMVNQANPVFPFYIEGGMTKISQPALFVEYEYFDKPGADKLSSKTGDVTRKAKKGILDAFDSPENSPYILDKFLPQGDLKEVSHRKLADKATYFNLDYYGYDIATGQLRTIGELAGAEKIATSAAMVAIHIVAEDPYMMKTKRTPKVELYTKAWSFKAIQDNKYPEYFGHLDRDLRF